MINLINFVPNRSKSLIDLVRKIGLETELLEILADIEKDKEVYPDGIDDETADEIIWMDEGWFAEELGIEEHMFLLG